MQNTAPVSAPATVEKKAPENLDIEEFIARTAAAPSEVDKPVRVRKPFTLAEKICFAAGGALLIALLGWLGHAAVSAADGGRARSNRKPDLPLKGKMITVTEATSGWRKSV